MDSHSRIPASAAEFEDAALVRQSQAGEIEAFTALVRKYQERVYNTCLRVCGDREDAQDLTQDAFLKAFEAIGSFKRRSSFYTWIFRIAVNMSISHVRKRGTRTAVSLNDSAGYGGESQSPTPLRLIPNEKVADPSDEVEALETHERIALALLDLEPDHRAVIVLRDVEGLNYQEIAAILDWPVGTVKSRIHRGRLALRDRLRSDSTRTL